jgi:hypothetical protein
MSDKEENNNANKVMLGFVVRRCAKELGHSPTPDEFARWANNRECEGTRYSIFGQAISVDTAKVMFRHMGRIVTVRSEDVITG